VAVANALQLEAARRCASRSVLFLTRFLLHMLKLPFPGFRSKCWHRH